MSPHPPATEPWLLVQQRKKNTFKAGMESNEINIVPPQLEREGDRRCFLERKKGCLVFSRCMQYSRVGPPAVRLLKRKKEFDLLLLVILPS